MPADIDLSLDGVYRAVVGGLQVGLGTALIFCMLHMLDIVFWHPLFSFWPGFVVGTLLGAIYIFYQDTLKVLVLVKNCVGT
jgi:hypothetical protein